MKREDYENCKKTEPDLECFKCPRMSPKYAYCDRLHYISRLHYQKGGEKKNENAKN